MKKENPPNKLFTTLQGKVYTITESAREEKGWRIEGEKIRVGGLEVRRLGLVLEAGRL